MYLSKLQISNVRAIEQAELELSPHINIITGINGSGKTSFLEAIYILGVGRSFRSNQIKSIIHHKSSNLTVFGKLSSLGSDSLGISRDRDGKFNVRINGIDQKKLSSLAHFLPVLVITPDSYKLLTSGPRHRRQFLDFSVFHVEQGFSDLWQRYNRILKQRNAQLKKCQDYQSLAIWDNEFSQLAERLNQSRKKEFLHLKTHLEDIQGMFLPQYRVQYNYYSGWDSGSVETFSQQLKSSFGLDRRYGYSTIGAHKAEIRLSIENHPVQDVLSRGEQKMLVNALLLAQAKRLSEDIGKHCLLLLDDLPSELDKEKQQLLINQLVSLPKVQLFLTAITKKDLSDRRFNNERLLTKVFHVEQGKISIIEK